FGAFWSLFELRILKNEWLDDDSKLGRLWNAVCDVDKCNIAGLSVEECKTYLFKKYRSPTPIRQYMLESFCQLGMKNAMDLSGLREIADALETSLVVVKSAVPKSPELSVLLFNIVYSLLDEKTRLNYWMQSPSGDGNPSDLASYIERMMRALCAHQVATSSVAGYLESDEPLSCHCCGEQGHVVKNCPKRKAKRCFKC